ncbi:MAG: CARDB domain-containing protein [Candidatus Acidiferrales bacterium]
MALALASPAQVPGGNKSGQSRNTAAASTQPVNVLAEMGPVTGIARRELPAAAPAGPDLVVTGLNFSSRGRVRYRVMNIGRSATGNPFVLDIYIDGQRRDTVKHNPLPAMSQQSVESRLARPDGCQSMSLRAAADSQNLVTEADESNNRVTANDVPPCPDLVVKITKDSVNNNLEYRAKVTVTNIGNLTSQRQFDVLLTGVGSVGATPIRRQKRVGPLEPGESVSFFEEGKHYGTTSMSYHALVDRLGEIEESSENNNQDRRSMGPG